MASLAASLGHADRAGLRAARPRRARFARLFREWRSRVLRVPLLWKLFGANAIIVFGTAATAITWHVDEPRVWITTSIALLATFTVNGALVYLALRPLAALEDAAGRVSRGERSVRVPRSALADRNMARVGETINRLVDRLTADRFHMRKLAAQVITAGDEERARIARQLQDSAAQTLAALSLQASSASRECTDADLAARLAVIHSLAGDALDEIRTLAQTVYPRVLDDVGLPAALKWLARRSRSEDVDVVVELGEPVGLSRDVEAALYHVASEALASALSYAQPSRVVLRLTPGSARVTLEVMDDGAGFDVSAGGRSFAELGYEGIAERLSLVDGALGVDSAPGRGTRVTASVPLEAGV